MSDVENIDDFLEENVETHISMGNDQINTTLETSTPDRKKTSSKRLSGFTGAPVDGNGIMIQELRTLLKTIKNEAKNKGDEFQRIRSEDPNYPRKKPARSLFGSTYTPATTGDGISALGPRPLNNFGGGYTSGFPWANDLSKIPIPKLDHTDPEAIVAFQRKYKEYVRAVHELEERYSSKIPLRTVYSCLTSRTLHYLCFMSELIPKQLRQSPDKMDRGVIHQVIMDFEPTDSTEFTMQLDAELNKIQIKMWPDGMRSIESAWNKLFDLDVKYKSIQLKPKKTIRILTTNLLPRETSKMLMASMSTGTQRDQDMASDLMLFHKRLVEIAKAARLLNKCMSLSHSKSSGVGYAGVGEEGTNKP